MDSTPTQEAPTPALLQIDRLRFRCQAMEPMRLPLYSGSAWRGVLGRSLRQTVCVTRQPTCQGCLLLHNCVYSTFFESPPATPEIAARYSALPHPYVLEPQIDARRALEPGEVLELGISLMGPATAHVPYLIHALQRAGEWGLARDGGRFAVVEVEQETVLGNNEWTNIFSSAEGKLQRHRTDAAPLPACPPAVSLTLQTPLRIKHHGRFIGPAHLSAADLLRTLISRVDLLIQLYAPTGAARPWDAGMLHDAVPNISLSDAELRWHEWTRYSSRQRAYMQLGGLLGRLQLSGAGLPTLWPLLWLGQWTHLGKGTSFGLGRYRLAG